LWFKLNNRYAKKKEGGSLNLQGFGFQRQKSLKQKKVSEMNVMAEVSKGTYHINDSPIHEVTED
jgi:hypothetical protein